MDLDGKIDENKVLRVKNRLKSRKINLKLAKMTEISKNEESAQKMNFLSINHAF